MELYLIITCVVLLAFVACYFIIQYYRNKAKKSEEKYEMSEAKVAGLIKSTEIKEQVDTVQRNRKKTQSSRIKEKLKDAKEDNFQEAFYDADDTPERHARTLQDANYTPRIVKEEYNYRRGGFTSDRAPGFDHSDNGDRD